MSLHAIFMLSAVSVIIGEIKNKNRKIGLSVQKRTSKTKGKTNLTVNGNFLFLSDASVFSCFTIYVMLPFCLLLKSITIGNFFQALSFLFNYLHFLLFFIGSILSSGLIFYHKFYMQNLCTSVCYLFFLHLFGCSYVSKGV